MPLFTTFAGDSARGEGLVSSSGVKQQTLYVTNGGENAVYKINPALWTAAPTKLTGGGMNLPMGMAASTDGLTLYVTNNNATYAATGIDLATFSLGTNKSTYQQGTWNALADNTYLYASNASQYLSRTNISTNVVTSPYPATGLSYWTSMVFNANKSFIYARQDDANISTGSIISKISTSTFNVTQNYTLTGTNGLSGLSNIIALDPTGTYLYAPSRIYGVYYLEKINTSTGAKTTLVTTPFFDSLFIDPTGTYLYALDGTGNVTKYDLSTFSSVGTLAANGNQSGAYSGAMDSTGTYLYVVGINSYRVSRLILSTFTWDTNYVQLSNSIYPGPQGCILV